MKHPEGLFDGHVCSAPFEDFMVLADNTNVCCPEWFDFEEIQKEFPEARQQAEYEGRSLGSHVSRITDSEDLLSNWNNAFHKALRNSVYEGDYRFCSKNCPHINRAYKANSKNEKLRDDDDMFKSKHHLTEKQKENLLATDLKPKRIYFNFDKACNLKCPSCRLDVIPNGATPHAETKLKTINEQFGDTVEHIVITGSGDPFYSNIFRNWFQTFDATQYPKLRDINIISNGNMFTPKMWKLLSRVHSYLHIMEWSIDAGTKHTYEARTRLNGNWNKLLSNMKFLASLNHFREVIFSFVVQRENFREMETFVELIHEVFEDSDTKVLIMFRRLQDWGHQKKSWVNALDVCDPNHIEHHAFLEQFEKVVEIEGVESNLTHLLLDQK